MSVLLVFPKYTARGTSATLAPTHPPLGISYLAAFLDQHGVEVALMDLNVSAVDDLHHALEHRRVSLLGFSISSFTVAGALALAKGIKARHPQIRIVFGGPAAPYLTEHLRSGVVDFFVLGEGETPLLELWRHVSMGSPAAADIANIAFVAAGNIVVTPRAPPPVSIDALPFPDRRRLDLVPYTALLRQCYVLTSRGCPFSCQYCLSGQIRDPVRQRSIDNVMAEVHEIRTRFPFFNRLRFQDETLNLGKKRLVELCTALGRENMGWLGNIRPDDTVDDEVLTLIKQSGAAMIEVGGESGSQEILDRIHRHTRVAHLEAVLARTTALGLPVMLSFMLPHYCDTPATLAETLAVMRRFLDQYLVILLAFQTSAPVHVGYGPYRDEFGLVLGPDHEIVSTKLLTPELVAGAVREGQQLQLRSQLKHSTYVLGASGKLG